MEFGEILKELIEKHNLTQEALAKAIGYSQRAISKWINKQSEPTATAIVACANFFQVSAGYLLGMED